MRTASEVVFREQWAGATGQMDLCELPLQASVRSELSPEALETGASARKCTHRQVPN